MSIYQITARADGSGFQIEALTATGVRHIMLGFETVEEAQEWIAADQERERRQSS